MRKKKKSDDKPYSDVGDGWIRPCRTDFRLACCGCGKTHKIKLRLVDNENGGKSIEMKFALTPGPRVKQPRE